VVAGIAAVVPLGAWTAGPADAARSSGASLAPGVTSTRITTGFIGTLTGPLSSDNEGLLPGVEAYFDTVNASGGVDGRKLDLAYKLNDEGNPSEFSTLARSLVNQDHVFAVTGIATDFFSPTYFTETDTPTYGYDTTGGWSGPSNLFAAGGSVQCYSCTVPSLAYLVKRAHAHSVALLAYNVSASSALCATTADMFRKAGIKVSYEDLDVPIDGNVAPDVQRLASAGSDFIMSCMDVTGNISMARAVKQYGLKVNQLWFSGYDQSVIDQYSNLMQGVYFLLQNVPLTAPTADYPGMAAYLRAMRKYEPQYLGDALAEQGWESAALFVAGVRAAGSDLTQQRVIQLTNQMTDFTAGGLTTVVNWRNAHTTATFPNCQAYVRVQGTKLVSQFGRGHQVFVCFAKNAVAKPEPVPAPPGTPGG
jgi:branched-chain amino acid transport system substrate-binding protein